MWEERRPRGRLSSVEEDLHSMQKEAVGSRTLNMQKLTN